jgi:uncharacterized membrane protein (UPF0127 family)
VPHLSIDGATPAAAPFGHFQQVRASIASGSSKPTPHKPCMLLAATPATRAEGLMHVSDPTLDGYRGMVFAFDVDATGTFTMAHTLIPLEVIFFDHDGRGIAETEMVPCPTGVNCPTYPSPKPYRWAVEVPEGRTGGGFGPEPTDLRLSVGGKC